MENDYSAFRRSLEVLGRLVRVSYFLRAPITAMLTLPLLGLLAVGPSRSMLEGLLDLEGNPLGVWSVAFTACLAAAAAVTAINLTLWYGTDRFELKFSLDPHRFPLLIFFAGFLCAATLFSCLCVLTRMEPLLKVLMGVCGFLAAALVAISAKYLQLKLTDPGVTTHPPPYLIFPVGRLPLVNRWFENIYLRPPSPAGHRFKAAFGWIFFIPIRLLTFSRPGYLAQRVDTPKLLSGHVFATSLAVLSFAVYYVIGFLKQQYIGQKTAIEVPSLSYVLLALLLFTWVLPATTFFLDRYRFPLFTALILFCLVTTRSPIGDHFYRVKKISGAVFPSPSETLRWKIHSGRANVPVFIATAGGGIQASAWTATVIAGIAKACRTAHPPCDFQSALTVISSVSGGSVGAMHVGVHLDGNLDDAIEAAKTSSLDDVAWGWVNPDIWRTILPWFRSPTLDRGWALERSLEQIDHIPEIYLQDWANRIPSGFPAFLFNATNIETGSAIVYSTTRFGGDQPDVTEVTPASHMEEFHAIYRNQLDVRLSTAARLSASFPYVSPASRPDTGDLEEPGYHVVDGGYYDNYGIFTLIRWLSDGLSGLKQDEVPRQMVLIRILPFPSDGVAQGSVHGWFFQVPAPLVAFLDVRSTAQLTNSTAYLRLFAGTLGEVTNTTLRMVDLQYPQQSGECSGKPPLSWKLTKTQKNCIDNAWTSLDVQQQVHDVVAALQSGLQQE